MSSRVRWSLVADSAPAWRRWDDEYVVHHLLANDTYRLSEAAGSVLQCLVAAGRMDASEVARTCALDEGQTCATLTALAELGFVVPC